MIGAAWFSYRGRRHALRDGSDRVSECGLSLIDPPTVTVVPEGTPPAEQYPPDACPTCLVRVGMRSVVDESLEGAVARGYVAVDD